MPALLRCSKQNGLVLSVQEIIDLPLKSESCKRHQESLSRVRTSELDFQSSPFKIKDTFRWWGKGTQQL